MAALLGLAALLAISMLTLTQCRMIGDRLTGVSVSTFKNNATACILQCQTAANDAIRVESQLHVVRVQACADDADCLAAEEARHEAAVDAIQTEREACVSGCHHQGGGDGGR
jgi:hypothetical protein